MKRDILDEKRDTSELNYSNILLRETIVKLHIFMTLLFLLVNGIRAADLDRIEWSETEDERIKTKYQGNRKIKSWVFKKKPNQRGIFNETFEYLPQFPAYTFRPFDEGNYDATFLPFRRKLLSIVEKRDMKSLLTLIDPEDIKGDPEKTFYGYVGSRDQLIFEELLFCLRHGGRFYKNGNRTFLAPYIKAGWPENYDLHEFTAVVKAKVKAHSAPYKKAPVIKTIGHCLVRSSFSTQSGWVRIGLPSGRVAYVSEDSVWNDFGFYFIKKGGRWFINGITAAC